MNSKQTSKVSELFPHPLPWIAYLVWTLCLIFNFFISMVEFGAWEIAASKMLAGKETLAIGRVLFPFNFCIILFQFPVALLLDKCGPRRMTSILIFCAALGILLFGYSNTVPTLWWSMFVIGIGGTVTVVNTLKVVSNWFLPKRFTIMLGWSLFALILGGAIGQKLTRELLNHFEWSKVMFTYGLIGVVYAILFFTVARDSQPAIRYQVIPNPKKFKLMPAVKRALSRRENYLLALICGLVFSQWYTFYAVWHTHFYNAIYQITDRTALILNATSMSCFAGGSVFFLYIAAYLKKRKVIMMAGIVVATILSFCNIYISALPLGVHVFFDCIICFSTSTLALVYTLIYEKNIPAISATVIGMLQIALAFFRITGERVVLFILETSKGSKLSFSNLSVENFQSAFIVIPLSLAIAFIVLIFIKETYGKQVYEESN